MKNLFKMDGELDSKSTTILTTIGLGLILIIWYVATTFGNVSSTIFPSPIQVLKTFKELITEYSLFGNSWYSIKLNFYGYVVAILIAVPLGFIIGLFPICKGLFSRWVDSIRFIPLTAVTGLFVAWFGIELGMKVDFLAFGILIYLLPIVVQRIVDTEKIHKQTIWTIGATNWQSFWHVYWPSVTSKLFNDIKVLVAISWTYIIVAEMTNASEGLGYLIFKSTKQGRVDMAFAILIVIIFVGYLQDLLFSFLDKFFFPYKYESSQIKADSKFTVIKQMFSKIFIKPEQKTNVEPLKS